MPPKTRFTHRAPRAWLKISINVPARFADIASAVMASLATSGIEQKNCTQGEADGGERELITAYLPENEDPTPLIDTIHDFLDTLNQKISGTNPASLTQERIEEEDWNSHWKEHFKAFKLSEHLVIKPSWEHYEPQAGELILEMDPGMAFGTGLHASTKLALQLIEESFSTNPPATVLDIGTGTGILGMSCALLGAKTVVGIDNDIDARTAAAENIANNHLESLMRIDPRDLCDLDGHFQLVIANITQDILTLLAPDIRSHLAPEGSVVLSGILTGIQSETIKALYARLGLGLAQERSQDEWTGLLFTHQSNCL